MEQILSSNIHQFNGSEETKVPSPETNICKSRFSRKQRLDQNQTYANGEPTKEIVITDTDVSRLRSSSSPPPPSILLTGENIHTYLRTEHRPSLPTTYSGYQRKKSSSVKLTRHDENPSSPKKAVRFADDFGLELSQMRVIDTDELPWISSEAFKHLQINHEHDVPHSERVKVITYMESQFENPLYTPDFNNRVARNKIVLEQANSTDNRIYGTIRLVSLGLHKRVKVRVTTDNWQSFQDSDASYIDNSYDGLCDRFSFTLEINRDRICLGNNLQFCICYESFGGREYWDNNSQQNYRFNCFSRTIPDYNI